jgi:hypothetical protein
MSIVASDAFDGEPSREELAAIEAEWSVIAAEMKLLDAEIAVLAAPRPVPPLDWTRVRAAERDVIAAWLAYWLAESIDAGTEAA